MPSDYKKWYSQLPCLALSKIGIVSRTSWQACLLCPWARHLTGCLHLYVANRLWSQAVYPSWWPSLTEDSQTEHERSRNVCTSSCKMLRTNSSNDENETSIDTKSKKSFIRIFASTKRFCQITIAWYKETNSSKAICMVQSKGKKICELKSCNFLRTSC